MEKTVQNQPGETNQASQEKNFRDFFEKIRSDPAQLQQFNNDPVALLQKNNLPVPEQFDVQSMQGSGNVALSSDQITVTTHWWGVDFIMNEAMTQDLIKGVGAGRPLTDKIVAAMEAASMGLGPVGTTVAKGISMAFAAKASQIKMFDRGNGVHWPVTWLQWGGILMAAPVGPSAILAAMAIYLHPFGNSSAPHFAGEAISGNWQNLGLPSSVVSVALPLGIYNDEKTANVFAMGSDGNLWTCSSPDLLKWTWINLNNPGNDISIGLSMGVCAVGSLVFVLGMGSDGNLWSCSSPDLLKWTWANLSSPGNGVNIELSMGIGFVGPTPNVLGWGSDGNLWDCCYTGTWTWYRFGHPEPPVDLILSLTNCKVNGAVTAVSMDSDGNAWTCQYNGGWNWENVGTPGIDLTLVLSMDSGLAEGNVNVFGIGSDDQLWTLYNNNGWKWTSLGMGENLIVASAGTGQIGGNPSVFGLDTNGNLAACVYQGGSSPSEWVWSDQGNPGASLELALGSVTNGQESTVFAVDENNNVWAYAFS